MDSRHAAEFRAVAETSQGFGKTPQEALAALMECLNGEASAPIVISLYNKGDTFFTESQQTRLRELKGRQALSTAEQAELEALVAASFDATIARTQAIPLIKK